jgi:hypothetical protein
MTMSARWTIYAAAAFLAGPLFALSAQWHAGSASAQEASAFASAVTKHPKKSHHRQRLFDEADPAAALSGNAAPKPPPAASTEQLPPRVPFTAAEDAVATIPGIPEARFWADSTKDFKSALPSERGPWLVLSSGGSDGAFGAGLFVGLGADGKRPDYAVVTGVSTGALMAPFIFAGHAYDNELRETYTKVSAADIFEAGRTAESFVDSWPLKEMLAKKVTPALLEDIAAAHRGGRRLFIVTTDLDAERSVVWNMGAIAAHGGKEALTLFRNVLLASAAIPGGFPPVLIDVEANGKHFAEMHVDGGVGGQFFIAPPQLIAANSDYRLPATELYIVVNTGLERDFSVVDRFVPSILTQTVSAAVKVDTRLLLNVAYTAAKRSGVGFNVATIPPSFNTPSKGPFDPDYMRALFQTGYELGKSTTPFANEPPPYAEPTLPSNRIERAGAN